MKFDQQLAEELKRVYARVQKPNEQLKQNMNKCDQAKIQNQGIIEASCDQDFLSEKVTAVQSHAEEASEFNSTNKNFDAPRLLNLTSLSFESEQPVFEDDDSMKRAVSQIVPVLHIYDDKDLKLV